jgi:hypothetical protein
MGDLHTIIHTPDSRSNGRGRGHSSWGSPQPDRSIDRRLLLGHENAEIVQLTFRAAGLVASGLLAANFDPGPAEHVAQ